MLVGYRQNAGAFLLPLPTDFLLPSSITESRILRNLYSRRHLMRRAIFLLISAVLCLSSLQLLAQSTYTTEQAKSHIGEEAIVCGIVASAHYAALSKGQPTF